jgi:hypothetical protein
MPGQQFYLQCRFLAGDDVRLLEVPLQLTSPAMPAQLDQSVALPAPLAPLKLKQYLPQAVLEQQVVPNSALDAVQAIEVAIDGPKQSYRRWLVADDSARNRLTSFIGTWRYMCVADREQRNELFAQFENELTREPQVLVSRPDGSGACRVPAEVGQVRRLDGLGCTVRIRKFYPHFGIDRESGEPVNQSDKRLNPAVLIEIESDDRKEERWAFAKFSDFKAQTETLPFRAALDCPLEPTRSSPDFAIVTVGENTQEVWTRHAGRSVSREVRLNEPVDVPGSQYTFHLARYVPAGRLVEEYRAARGRGATPALQLETSAGGGSGVSIWLPLGKERVISTTQGPLEVSFGPRRRAAPLDHSKEP